MERKRVVVTGYGAISGIGRDVNENWASILAGKSGVAAITLFDASQFDTTIAGEVKNFDPAYYFDKREAKKMARFTKLACAAASMAADMAGIKPQGRAIEAGRIGVFLGVGIGGFDETEEGVRNLTLRGPRGVPPLVIPKLIANEAPANVAMLLKCMGPSCAVTTACSSGADAIVLAGDAIRAGRADIMITGGAEAAITGLGVAGFNKIGALATNFNDHPEKASRPFDRGHSGFVIGEGAGVLVLEEYEHAKKRGATIYAEYAGGAMTCDAYHLTAPAPDAVGAVTAFRLAMEDARINPDDVDYVNAHGTSTPVGDPIEIKAIQTVFGSRAKPLPVSSTKSMTAHTLGAAGGLEAIYSILAINHGFLPPTINLEDPIESKGVDFVPNVGKEAKIDVIMSDSLGFGGHNGVVCFKKFK